MPGANADPCLFAGRQAELVLICRRRRPVQLVAKQLWHCGLMGNGPDWEAVRKSGLSVYVGAGEAFSQYGQMVLSAWHMSVGDMSLPCRALMHICDPLLVCNCRG